MELFQFFFKVDHAHPPAYLLLSSWIQYHYNTQGTQKINLIFPEIQESTSHFRVFSVRNCGHAAIPPGLQECSVEQKQSGSAFFKTALHFSINKKTIFR